MRNKISRKKCLENHGVYEESYGQFWKSLQTFKKKDELFNQTRIREKTKQQPETIKKYLAVAVELGDVRPCQAYFRGCSPYELIVANFGFGDTLFCPSCNKEVLSPFEGDELVCECGIRYVKQDAKWVYKPRIEYLGNALWKLESLTCPGEEFYEVRPFEGYCSCPHHAKRGAYCKHLKQVTDLVANIVLDRISADSKSKGIASLVLISAALTRLFDHRKKLKQLTYQALENAIQKSGLKLTKAALTRIVSEIARKQVFERTHLPLTCIEGKTLFSVNEEVLEQFLKLDKSTIDSYTQSFKVKLPEHKAPFLKLDYVVYSDIIYPNSEFALSVDVNYCFSKPTPVRLELRDAQSHMILRSATMTLNGEDITSIPLKLNSLEIQACVPQIELYCQDDKKEWHLVDHYLAGRRIFAPTIKMSKTIAGLYEVESFSQPGKFYEVDTIGKRCTCPAYTWNQSCKHLEIIENIGFPSFNGRP